MRGKGGGLRLVRGALVFSFLLWSAAPARACVDYFSPDYFSHGGRNEAQMPPAWFPRELHVLLGLKGTPPLSEESAAKTCDRVVDADLAQLEAALRAAEKSDEEITTTLAEYQKMRCAMRETGDYMADWERRLAQHVRWKAHGLEDGPEPPKPTAFDPAPYEALLNRLPVEFSLYARGAAAYHSRNLDSALDLFTQVLALPAVERPFRTVWAAHMIGMTLMRMKEYDTARAAFDRVPMLAGEGFADPVGLAEGVGGWKVLTLYQAGDFAGAARGYLSEYMDGDAARRRHALVSLDWAFSRAATEHDPAQIAALLEDENARLALLAWSLANPSESRDIIEPVLAHFDALSGPVPGADRIAWLAYNRGDMEKAAKWAEKAGDASPMALWIRAKLLLRDGKMDEAIETLGRTVSLFDRKKTSGRSDAPEWKMYHEDYEGSSYVPLDVEGWAKEEWSVFWALKKPKTLDEYDNVFRYLTGSDAYHVAAFMMTIDELRDYVFRPLPANAERPDRGLADILCSRLIRAGRLEEAARLFPDSDAGPLLTALKNGRDPSLSKRTRAESLMEAARIMHDHMSYQIARGSDPSEDYYWAYLTANASGTGNPSVPGEGNEYDEDYLFADLLWEAATLLPNNDVLTAETLYTGGKCLRYRDPPAADRFYKALVRRNPNLAVAREADRLRWFPQEFDERVLYTPHPPSWLRGRRRILLAVLGGAAGLCALAGAVVFVRRRTSKTPSLNGPFPL